jgi:hypothetical protein
MAGLPGIVRTIFYIVCLTSRNDGAFQNMNKSYREVQILTIEMKRINQLTQFMIVFGRKLHPLPIGHR